MEWLDALLFNAAPVLLVMSVLAVIIPSLRTGGVWRGIGAAWLATLVATAVITVTHPNDWSMSCDLLGGVVIGAHYVNGASNAPCSGWNGLPSGLIALPSLIGIAILLAWVWRHIRPRPTTLGTAAALTALAVAIVALGQVNENAALLAVVAVAASAYAWPRLRRQRSAT